MVGPVPTLSPLFETLAVTRTELLRSIRNARVLVLLLLFGTSTALIGLVVGLLTRGLDAQGPEAVAAATSGVLRFLVGEDGAAFERLSELPLLVPLVYRVALFFVPLFIALLGCVAFFLHPLGQQGLAAAGEPQVLGPCVAGVRDPFDEACSHHRVGQLGHLTPDADGFQGDFEPTLG